jgi:hypothetical protein
MCHATTCQTCNKTTWSGCGQHLESVFRNVPVEKRCFCGYSQEELEQEKKHPKIPSVGPLPKGAEGCTIA